MNGKTEKKISAEALSALIYEFVSRRLYQHHDGADIKDELAAKLELTIQDIWNQAIKSAAQIPFDLMEGAGVPEFKIYSDLTDAIGRLRR